MGVQDFGKLIFILGIVLMLVGALLWKTGGLGGLGRLPGDLMIQKGNSSFYFPIVTCVLISLVLASSRKSQNASWVNALSASSRS